MRVISVIVPVYKVEPYLRRCADSVLSQTFRDFDLILVDDGSPDNCGSICDEYAEKDPRVHVIHQKNGGLSAARNAGIEWALSGSDSKWITFIDSDDWVHQTYLEALIKACDYAGTRISVCGFYRTDGESLPEISGAEESRVCPPEAFWCENQVNATIACGKLFQKSLWEGVRFPVGKIHEDEFTTYKLLFACEKISVLSSPLYYYYTNPNGITHSEWTPGHLVVADVFSEQLSFFEQNGYPDAGRMTAVFLLCRLQQERRQMRHFGKQYKRERSLFQKRFHAVYKKYRRTLTAEERYTVNRNRFPKLHIFLAFAYYQKQEGLKPAVKKMLGYVLNRNEGPSL